MALRRETQNLRRRQIQREVAMRRLLKAERLASRNQCQGRCGPKHMQSHLDLLRQKGSETMIEQFCRTEKALVGSAFEQDKQGRPVIRLAMGNIFSRPAQLNLRP
jgi:hypothetical protein